MSIYNYNERISFSNKLHCRATYYATRILNMNRAHRPVRHMQFLTPVIQLNAIKTFRVCDIKAIANECAT